MNLETGRVDLLKGELRPPSDKSLTHRAYLFASVANGSSIVRRPLRGEDCDATLAIVNQLGATVNDGGDTIKISPQTWSQQHQVLDCGNSGTTIRLLAGFVASAPGVQATLTGDASLSKRPMGRIAKPLRSMGAHIVGENPPLEIEGQTLRGIEYVSPVASGQVKSCLLMAGLRSEGATSITEPSLSRDHTERMFEALGAPLVRDGLTTRISKGTLASFDFEVPGDLSSAAFPMVAAAALPGSEVRFVDIGLNPTRAGVLEVLRMAGADVVVEPGQDRLGEPVGDVWVRGAHELKSFEVRGELVPRLIDEIPVLAVLATQCFGGGTFRDAKELRVKECDRIDTVAEGLRAMGAKVETFEDGLRVEGPVRLQGTAIDARMDHRIAMAFAIAGLLADGTTTITGADAIRTSYPDFEKDLMSLAVV